MQGYPVFCDNDMESEGDGLGKKDEKIKIRS